MKQRGKKTQEKGETDGSKWAGEDFYWSADEEQLLLKTSSETREDIWASDIWKSSTEAEDKVLAK